MINEQQKQAIAVLNRLHGQGPNAGILLTDAEYFMLMEYVLICSIRTAAHHSALLSNCADDGRSVTDAPYEVTCKFGKVED